MNFDEHVQKAFDEWLNEVEGFSLRIERLHSDVRTEDRDRLMEWLKAAFEQGAAFGWKL